MLDEIVDHQFSLLSNPLVFFGVVWFDIDKAHNFSG